MSRNQSYSERDAEQFADLMKKTSSKASVHKGKVSASPNAQATQNYTQGDIEKFQKMFSAGFAADVAVEPARPERPYSERPAATQGKSGYSPSDERQFQNISPRAAPRKPSTEPAKGGRIGNRSQAATFNSQDLAQFEDLAATVAENARNSGKSRARDSGDRPNPGDRQWRFPELHDATKSALSSASQSMKSGRSSLRRARESRIKLRYFD